MRRRAQAFTAPAQVNPDSIVAVLVVATDGEHFMPERESVAESAQVITGHLRMLGLEIVPVEQPRRPWWRPKQEGGSQ